MSESITNVNRILVEFTDGTRGLLTTDDEHEWVIHCVAKEISADEWCAGVLEEIEAYVNTWPMFAPDAKEHGIASMVNTLRRLANTLEEEWQENWMKQHL